MRCSTGGQFGRQQRVDRGSFRGRRRARTWVASLRLIGSIPIARSAQVLCGTTPAFQASYEGSTPSACSDAAVVQQPRHRARISGTRVRFSPAAPMLLEALE